VNERAAAAPAGTGGSALRVGLTLGGIVLAAIAIFALGVMEGSRVVDLAPRVPAPPSAPPTENTRALPASAPPAPTASVPPDKLTFYDRLSGVAPPAALPEAPQAARGPVPVTAPLAQEPTAPVVPAPAPAPALPKAAAAPARAVPAPIEVAVKVPQPAKTDAAAQIRKLVGKGKFSVQTAAVADRAAAAQTASLLRNNGFEAVTAMASVKGKIWYRIRVGSFPNRQAAAQAAGIFHAEYGLDAIPVEN